MQISPRLFWSVVIGFIVLIVVVFGAVWFSRPRVPKGQPVTDPQKILELEHPELEYFRGQPSRR